MSRSQPNQPGTVGARGPLKPEKFFVPSRPQAPPISLGDDSDNWWGGVFQCASSIALGTAVAISSLSTTQASAVANSWQDEFGSGGIHEDYWQNPTQPTILSLGALYAPDVEEIPAGSLVNKLIDEDYWQPPLTSSLPTSTTPQSPLPSIVDPDFAPFFPDEDYWQNLPPFIVTLSFYQPSTIFIDPDQIFPLATSTPDEDYWQNRVNPVSSILGPLYIPDPEELTAGLLVNLTVDELYWQNPVTPVIASLWQPLPLVVDPDFTPSFMEEYYWQNPTAPISATTYQRLPLGDPEELSAGSLHGQPDEDFWVNPVASVQFVNICPQQFLFDVQEPAGSLLGAPDEYYWQNPTVVSLGWSPVQSFTPPHDEVIVPQPVTFHPDDDIWVTATSPIPSSFARLYLPDADDAPAGSLHGYPDEDFWANQVAPVVASLYQSLPYRPDPDEISAGDLFGQPDEDFWINPVNPVVASLWQPFPVGLYFESDAPVPVFGELSANVSSMALALDATIKHESRSLTIPGGAGDLAFILSVGIASSGTNNTLTMFGVGDEIILSATSLG